MTDYSYRHVNNFNFCVSILYFLNILLRILYPFYYILIVSTHYPFLNSCYAPHTLKLIAFSSVFVTYTYTWLNKVY